MNGNTNLLLGKVVPMPRRPGRSRANGITEPFDHFGYWNLMPDEETLKRATVRNVLNSYQGSYDLFIEAVQNAVDALEHRVKLVWSGEDIELADDPELWVILNLRESEVTVVDSGLGLTKTELMQILIPNLSLKHHLAGALGLNLRGHLGVGATFLAHATDYIRISTVGDDGYLSFELAGGRNWIMGNGNHGQPAARPATETCAEFNALGRGTAVTLRLGEGTRPAALSHLAATPKKWEAILRTKTAIGFVDLLGGEKWNKQVKVNLSLVDGTGSRISSEIPFLYPLPHTIGTFNSLNMTAYYQEHREGDTVAKKHLGQDALYRVWTKRQLFHPQKGILNKEECPHLHATLEGAYTFFAFSASLFGLLSELEVGDRTLPIGLFF